MTAVVGILNKQGVAIAADSAVSMTVGGGTKIINRANKIFRISRRMPVGLMIYNLGEFIGTPWEVICKEYRAKRGEITLETVAGYRDDFIRFLKEEKRFHNNHALLFLLNGLADAIVRICIGQIREVQKSMMVAPDQDLFEVAKKKVDQHLTKLVQEENRIDDYFDDFKNFTQEEFNQLDMSNFVESINIRVRRALGLPDNFFRLDYTDLKEVIWEYAFHLTKNKGSRLPFAGLVFVGYGAAEVFPALHPVNVMAMLGDRLQYCEDVNNAVLISHQMPSAVAPFAQTDVMETILSGASPPIFSLFAKSFLKHLVKANNELAARLKPIDERIAETISKINSRAIVEKIVQDVEHERQKLFVKPMMAAIASLSKEDLAEMAESLVYLTYLQRRFTFAPESVGGPVDVAVITKGDGFIWIKRKHYFSPELNQHFFRDY